ncbi:MAG: branched-chain amino acid ABC transporter substrate-binding protein [Anaerolineae bacterium]
MTRRIGHISTGQILLAALLALTVVLSACQPERPSVVFVYVSLPLKVQRNSGAIVNGVKQAFDEINNHIGNTEIKLNIVNDGDDAGQWLPDKEQQIATDAANDPLTVAYIGPYNSGAAKISIPITNKAGMLQISPSTTWPGLTKVGFAQGEPAIFYPTGKRTFFRTCSTDDLQGPAAALWARDLKFRSFYVLDDGETYGAGVAALFARRAEQIGLINLGRQTIDKTAQDFSAVLAAVKQANPDVVYFGGTVANGAALIVSQMRAMGIKSAFMGPDAIVDTALIDGAQGAAEGVYATFVGAPADQLTTEVGKTFYAEYKQKYNGEEPEAYAQSGYDAARVIIAAMQQADKQGQPINRANLLAYVGSGVDFNGAAGQFTFDRNGDTQVILVSGNVVQNGAFKFARLLTER